MIQIYELEELKGEAGVQNGKLKIKEIAPLANGSSVKALTQSLYRGGTAEEFVETLPSRLQGRVYAVKA